MGIDVPHSHEEEVRIDRLARERREGGLLIQRNEPISNRPSTTLTILYYELYNRKKTSTQKRK